MSFSHPSQNIKQFMLGVGMHVVDFGAGSGAYTEAAAQAVGTDGKVYAVDVQKDLLSRLSNTLKSKGYTNVEVVWGDIELEGGVDLRDGMADAALVTNTLFQAEDKKGLVGEVARILRPAGKLLIVDWLDSYGGLGPPMRDIVSAKTAKQLFEEGGFVYEKDISAGEHHYGLIMRKT